MDVEDQRIGQLADVVEASLGDASLAEGYAQNGDLARAIDLGTELANEDFSYRDIGRLLDEWQARVQNIANS